MDYIFLNTLVYGIIGTCFIYFLAYYKVLHLATWGFLVLGMYLVYLLWTGGSLRAGFLPSSDFEVSWRSFSHLTIFISIYLCIYFGAIFVCYRFFRNAMQRDLFSIIFTMSLTVFLENLVGFFFGWGAVSLTSVELSRSFLIGCLVTFTLALIYFFRVSFFGKFFSGVAQHPGVVKSLGFHVHKSLFFGSIGCLVILLFASFLVLTREGVRPTDGLFYLIVWLGMLVLVGVKKIEYAFFGALIYVLLEYSLFVHVGLPIAYKAPTMLIIIMLLLFFKPEGIFTYKLRKI